MPKSNANILRLAFRKYTGTALDLTLIHAYKWGFPHLHTVHKQHLVEGSAISVRPPKGHHCGPLSASWPYALCSPFTPGCDTPEWAKLDPKSLLSLFHFHGLQPVQTPTSLLKPSKLQRKCWRHFFCKYLTRPQPQTMTLTITFF